MEEIRKKCTERVTKSFLLLYAKAEEIGRGQILFSPTLYKYSSLQCDSSLRSDYRLSRVSTLLVFKDQTVDLAVLRYELTTFSLVPQTLHH